MNSFFDQGSEIASLLRAASRHMPLFRGDAPRIEPLTGDGSDRRFFRVRSGPSRYIALISARRKPPGADENDSYFQIGKHLHRNGLPVPRIIWADLDHGHFILEDLGDYHLQRHACRGGINLQTLYRRALGLLIKLHQRAPRGFQASYCFDTPAYDPQFVYERELEYFRNSFLIAYLGLDIAREDLHSDFENLAESAGVHETSLVMHRDFQSRNLMVHRGDLWILDFQGMRFGPPVYDLASLLVDPYVRLPRQLQDHLVELYWSSARRFLALSQRRFNRSYAALRLCRNLQALGAYGFLGAIKGKRQFLRYVPGAWRRLYEWIHGPCSGLYPDLQKCVRLAQIARQGRIESPELLKTFA